MPLPKSYSLCTSTIEAIFLPFQWVILNILPYFFITCLISDDMVAPGTVLVDAGTASEGGVLVGDISDSLRERKDLAAITPKTGGVGPLTVGVLFEDVIKATAL